MLGVGVLVSGCGSVPRSDAAAAEMRQIEVPIEFVEVRHKTINPSAQCTGQIRSCFGKEVVISSRLHGRLLKMLVQPGDNVKRGDVLGYIDSQQVNDLQAEVIEAASKLSLAEAKESRELKAYQEELLRPRELLRSSAACQQAKIGMVTAERDYLRSKQLYEEKIIAQKDFYKAEAALENAKVEVTRATKDEQRERELFNNKALIQKDWQLAHAETELARKELESLRRRLRFFGLPSEMIESLVQSGQAEGLVPVVSPSSGTVVQQHVAAGELVGPDVPIVTVCDLSKVAIKCDIPEADVAAVALGLPVEARVGAYPDRVFRGSITYIGSKLESQTRTVPVRVEIANEDELLKLDMFADVRIESHPRVALVCPRDAIHNVDNKTVVYVQNKDKTSYTKKEVSVGVSDGDVFEIKQGLAEGDVVATKGSLLLQTQISLKK